MLDNIKDGLIRRRSEIIRKLEYTDITFYWSNDGQYCENMLNHIREINENLKLIDELNNKEI